VVERGLPVGHRGRNAIDEDAHAADAELRPAPKPRMEMRSPSAALKRLSTCTPGTLRSVSSSPSPGRAPRTASLVVTATANGARTGSSRVRSTVVTIGGSESAREAAFRALVSGRAGAPPWATVARGAAAIRSRAPSAAVACPGTRAWLRRRRRQSSQRSPAESRTITALIAHHAQKVRSTMNSPYLRRAVNRRAATTRVVSSAVGHPASSHRGSVPTKAITKMTLHPTAPMSATSTPRNQP
jgi:hypothetical protein